MQPSFTPQTVLWERRESDAKAGTRKLREFRGSVGEPIHARNFTLLLNPIYIHEHFAGSLRSAPFASDSRRLHKTFWVVNEGCINPNRMAIAIKISSYHVSL